MKKYLLLRDNRQAGPHTIEQLGSIGLKSLDLIWIEDESTSWKHPGEIAELKDMIRHDILPKANAFSAGHERIFVSLPSNFSQRNQDKFPHEYSTLPINDTGAVLETHYAVQLEELKENYSAYQQKQAVWKKKIFPTANALSVATIFIGVALGAIIVKKWVDGYVPASLETAAAIPVIDREVQKQPDENLKNALVTEIVPVYKNTIAKPAKKIDLKKRLRVTTSNYKIGLFGGINGLQLTVFNASPQLVDKVIVALDYLRPNGVVVQSENIAFSSIKPKSAQTISLPGSSRGVKVQYRILKVYARDHKADPKQI